MEEKSNWFVRVFEAFKDSPIRFMTFVIICIATFFIYTQHQAITNSILIPDPSKEAIHFERGISRDLLINQSLEDFITKHKATHSVIVQYHNGQYDLTNLPFHKVSVTYSVGKISADISESLYITRPISSMAKLNNDMWHYPGGPRCVGYLTEELQDVSYRARMEGFGYRYTHLCPIENLREYPIGYVSVSYDYIPTEEQRISLEDNMVNLSTRIAGYLQENLNIKEE